MAIAGTSAVLPFTGDGNTIAGCYSSGGALKVRTPSEPTCPRGYSPIDWSVTGPSGAPGAAGPAGSQGPQGAAGPQGPPGPASLSALEGSACDPAGPDSDGTVDVVVNADNSIGLACAPGDAPPPEPSCDGNTNETPATALDLGSLSGDVGAVTLSHAATACSGDDDWYRFRLTENNFGDVYLSARVWLTSPLDGNADAYGYCGASDVSPYKSAAGTAGAEGFVVFQDDDNFGTDDSRDFYVRVHGTVGSTSTYSLDIYGNVNVGGDFASC